MSTTSDRLTEQDLEELSAGVRGSVVTPGDGDYDEARRVYNGMIDRHPVAIVRCVDAADVVAVVAFGRDRRLPLSVRGGGHNVVGFGVNDSGVVIDLSVIRNVRVDPTGPTVRVGGGALWGDVDHAAHAYGLAVPSGVISTTGVGGLTLGGGTGHLTRAYGLTCDNLVSADVVTAAGDIVEASETDDADLLWALRGGGGNFGVVTSFEFTAHSVKNVLGGPIFYEIDGARDLLRKYRAFMHTAPEQLGAFFGFHLAPPLPFIPENRHLEPMCAIVTCWVGDEHEGREVVRPLLEWGPPVASHVDVMPFPALNSAFDPLLPPGLQHYWKGEFVKDLTDEIIDVHVEYGPKVPHVSSAVHIYPVDGAVWRVAPTATAFNFRDVRYNTVIAAMYPDAADTPANMAWVRDYWSALHQHSAGGGYVNFLGIDDGPDRVAATYGENFERLRALKRTYDPGNVFRLNQNIDPA